MKGKHSKKNKRKQLKIVDKKKFIRSITFCILSLVLIGVVIFKITTENNISNNIKNNIALINNNIVNNMIKNIKANSNITTTNDMKVISRSSTTPRGKEKTPTVLESPETLYVNVKKGVNVRDTYSIEGNKIKALVYGTEVKVTEKMNNWGKIEDNQWVLLDNLSTTKPVIEETKKNVENNDKSNISTNESSENWIKFTATGYCSCSKCCGKSTGITASGTKATAGKTVAMSSKYSFGTKIEIKGMGTYVVEDRGGAINGNRIDIYFASHQEALNFGKRTVYLKILK